MGARYATVSPIGSPVNSSQEYWCHSPTSDFFAENCALLATPPSPCRHQEPVLAASSPAAPASPIADRPTASTVNLFPCAFNHRHSSSDGAQHCNSSAVLDTSEHPPSAAVHAPVERTLQIATAFSDERHKDEDTWSTISRTSRSSASTSTVRRPTVRTLASSSSGANTGVQTSTVGAAARHHAARSMQYQPPEDRGQGGE